MKRIITIIVLSFIAVKISAQETKNKDVHIEFGIKAQNVMYKPYEYRPTIDLLTNSKAKLNNNTDLVYPAFAKYRNFNKKFGVDFDMISIDISNATYRDNNASFNTGFQLGNIRRDEFNLNFYYLPFESNPNIFYFGLGIKKIDRFYQNQNEYRSSGLYSDKINAYGFSIPFRSHINIIDRLDLNLSLDPYIAFGRRKLVNQFSSTGFNGFNSYPIVFLTDTNPNSIAEIAGYQADVSLSYVIFENWKLYLGGSINKSRVRFINSQETRYTYFGDTNNLIIRSDRDLFTQNKYTSKYDSFSSIYFGISFIY